MHFLFVIFSCCLFSQSKAGCWNRIKVKTHSSSLPIAVNLLFFSISIQSAGMAAAENALKNGMHPYLIDPQFFFSVRFFTTESVLIPKSLQK